MEQICFPPCSHCHKILDLNDSCWFCINCEDDYVLCQDCELLQFDNKIHDKTHVFCFLRYPANVEFRRIFKISNILYTVDTKGEIVTEPSTICCDIWVKCTELNGTDRIPTGDVRYKCLCCKDWDCCQYDISKFGLKDYDAGHHNHLYIKLKTSIKVRITANLPDYDYSKFDLLLQTNNYILCRILPIARLILSCKCITNSKYIKMAILTMTFCPSDYTISFEQLDKLFKYVLDRPLLSQKHSKTQFLSLMSTSRTNELFHMSMAKRL